MRRYTHAWDEAQLAPLQKPFVENLFLQGPFVCFDAPLCCCKEVLMQFRTHCAVRHQLPSTQMGKLAAVSKCGWFPEDHLSPTLMEHRDDSEMQ